MKKKWTNEETQYLMENWKLIPFQSIMEALNRTKDSIARKARGLGLDMHKKEEDLIKRRWTKEEDQFIIEYYKNMPSDEISLYINRTASSIRKRARELNISSRLIHWTKEEEQFLFEKWGMINTDKIAKLLNRSRNAILLKACQISLREQITANGTYLTPADISNILDVNIRTLYTWMNNGCLRYRKFRVGKKTKYQITVDAFCNFIQNYQDKWDSKKADIDLIKSYCSSYFIAENGSLIIREKSIQWLEEKFSRDRKEFKKTMKPWTTSEEKELIHMLDAGYSYKEICCKLGRSMGSTKTKIYMLRSRVNF